MLELRELRPGVQRQPSLHGQLPRLQHLRHRAAGQAEAAGVGGLPRRPGRRVGPRQPAVHVGGADARPARLRHAGRRRRRSSAERFRGVRIFDISDVSKPKQVAAVQTCRGSHTHTLVHRPERHREPLRLRSGTGSVRSAEELAGCSGLKPDEDPNTALFSIDVIQVPLAAPQNAEDRQPAAHLRRRGDRRHRRALAGRRPRARARRRRSVTNQCHDITVFPEVGLAAGACSGNGILLDIKDPENPVRLDHVVRQELRLLALGDVQQRRHQGDLHRRVGRRHAAALPRDRPADLGRRRDLRRRRSQAALRRLLQDAGGADRDRELRRAQRLAHPGAGPRHHGAGVVSGRRVGVRFHRLGASRSRSRSSTAARSTRSS